MQNTPSYERPDLTEHEGLCCALMAVVNSRVVQDAIENIQSFSSPIESVEEAFKQLTVEALKDPLEDSGVSIPEGLTITVSASQVSSAQDTEDDDLAITAKDAGGGSNKDTR